ncbi:unnamed protein product [Pleuronectes platessa]|uniref:Uncharacterized protein n=1 Tax=Pleuronectes platessa TaxID=8262 RepID=A0A9N7VQB6_PLEPL|nr:unnamed protein product [Pleuronectes platessa]
MCIYDWSALVRPRTTTAVGADGSAPLSGRRNASAVRTASRWMERLARDAVLPAGQRRSGAAGLHALC